MRRGSNVEQQKPERPVRQTPAAPDYQPVRDLRERLPLAIEVLNAAGVLLFPTHPAALSRRLRRLLLENEDVQRHAAAARRMDSIDVVVTTIAGLRIAFSGFTEAQETLCVAEPEEAASADPNGEYLRHVVATLAANRAPDELREIIALEQLLAQAASAGIERDVVAAFIEAVAVWHDLDACSYVANDRGDLVRDAALAGATEAPDVLLKPANALAPAPYLAAVDAQAWGFAADAAPVFMILTEAGITPRVVAVLNAQDAAARATIAMYEPALRRTLRAAAEAESSRLIWALMQTLLGDPDSLEQPLTAAAAELSQRAVWTVAITVVRHDGSRIVAIGTERCRAYGRTSERFCCGLPLADGFTGSLELARPSGHPFTAREHRLADTAAALLGTWLAAAIRSGRFGRDRRASAATFEEQVAKQAAAVRRPLAAIVFKADSNAARVRRAIATLRRRLRPLDMAGLLASGDVGILLVDATTEQAWSVAARLGRLFEAEVELSWLLPVRVGIGAASEGEPCALPLLAHASAAAAGAAVEPAYPRGEDRAPANDLVDR